MTRPMGSNQWFPRTILAHRPGSAPDAQEAHGFQRPRAGGFDARHYWAA
jgi:hypothetical protein